MDKLSLCRVCLSENVDYLIENTKVQDVYERLTATQLQTNDGRSRSVCYMCYAQLVKTHKLMVKCLKAENILTQMLHQIPDSDGKVNFQATPINKWGPISSHLSVTPIEQNNIDSDRDDIIIKHEIKFEPEDEIEDMQSYEVPNETAVTRLSQVECEFEETKDDIQIIENMNTNVQEPSYKYHVPIINITSDDNDGDETYYVTVTPDIYTDDEKPIQTNTVPRLSFEQKSNTSTGNKQFACRHCPKSYTSKKSLVCHTRGQHADQETDGISKKLFICDICNKNFGGKYPLSMHLKVHTVEKPYECSICKKMFSQKRYLNMHKKLHSVEKPYECTVCKREFLKKSYLTIHAITHTGVKRFECDICQKAFYSNGQLKIHYRTHTGERPYTCDICKWSFAQKGSLIKHLKRHGADKPYRCDISKTNHRSVEKKHRKRHKL